MAVNSSTPYQGLYQRPCNDNAFGPAISDCHGAFDFTLLFEQSILSIGPSALLLLLGPLRLYQLYGSTVKTLPDPGYTAKAVATLVFATLQLTLLVLWTSHAATRASVPSATLSFLDALAILALSYAEHTRSIRPSALLNVYLFFSFIMDVAQIRTLFLRFDNRAIIAVSTTSMCTKMVLLLLEMQSKRRYLKFPYRSYPPEATSGVFNRSFFWWINLLFRAGFRKLLSFNDLYALDEDLLSEPLGVKMQGAWDQFKDKGRYALIFAAASSLRWPLLSSVFPRLCLIAFSFAQPFLITRAIDFISQPATNENSNIGYGLIAATGLIYSGIALSTVHYTHRLFRMITMFRGALVSLIYNRTLTLRAGVYDGSAAVTLMSTDVDRIVSSLEDLHEVWARLIEVIIGIFLLERQVGWVCIAPIVVVAASSVGNVRIARFMGGRQKTWVQAIQQRIAITSSMLGSMKSVKMMGLADAMSTTIQGQRVRELRVQGRYRWLVVLLNVFSNVPAIVAPVSTFVIFAIKARLQGSEVLSTAQVFTSLSIITLMTNPAAQLLSSVPFLAAAMGCFDRVQQFLLTNPWEDRRLVPGASMSGGGFHGIPEEVDGVELQDISIKPSILSQDLAITFAQATIRPAPNSEPTLHDVSLQIKTASLTMIVGPIGSGKSTLMRAMLGELSSDSGMVMTSSKHMAYCAQTPWLLNTSIQQIVCGTADTLTFDREWYRTVMYACALDEDMLLLPEGDQSVIGSRGLTLSGGQKQRLALARAAYSRQDIVLLDDVLSALDAKTEGSVVERLLGKQGLFRKLKSTIILITHATRHLPMADEIIVLTADGHVAEQGTFEGLRLQQGFVSSILFQPDRPKEEHDGVSADSNLAGATSNAIKGPTANDLMDLTRRTGDVAVYGYYLKSIGWKSAMLFIFSTVVVAFSLNFPQVWLKWWTDDHGAHMGMYISIYIVIAVVALASTGTQIALLFLDVVPKSAARLHSILLRTVMRAPQSFFAETDTGVTLNRFSQDMTLIDGTLPIAVLVTATRMAMGIAQAALISTGSSYMGITIPFVLVFIYFLQDVYLRTSRQLRFIDLEAKSPLYSHFLETLDGLSTIRAFGWEDHFSETNIRRLDASQRPYYLLYCIQRWLNLVLDLLVAALAVIVVALAIQLRGTTSAGLLGIALNNVLAFNQSLSLLVSFWTSLETSLGAIARVKGFEAQTTPEEKPGETVIPPEDWPDQGAVTFHEVTAAYGPGALALRNISMSIGPGQKIGICGRTGSGKSSLLLTLLRLLDVESGTITIDGMDLTTMPRETIRSRMIAIPQDPFILSGSVRLNADPTGSVPDALIISALSRVHLWDLLLNRGGLDADMNSQPLSQGQQQLFCLARAMLRKSKILILDEATSNVDRETDQVMQRVIREEFRGITIITVAHRLDTIVDADRVAVLQGGRLVEFGRPEELLARASVFRELSLG